MQEPKKIKATKPADYLNVITRAVFQAGFNWKVVEAKWPGFEEVFLGFDPEAVAALRPKQVEKIAKDPRVIRNRAKIEATVHNAVTLLELSDQHRSFRRYLRSHDGFEDLTKDMVRNFKFLGDTGAYYVLWVVNEKVPSYEDWSASRGIDPHSPPKRARVKR
jgi:3-methyladenine DNA glycosylase Tag